MQSPPKPSVRERTVFGQALAALALFAVSVPLPLKAEAEEAKAATAKDNELPAKTVVTGDDEPAGAGKAKSKSGSGSQAIVALVNDEPITGYELQQRAAVLGGGAVQERAQENFKALIKNPKTTERLKAILNEVVKANPGKSRDEIIAIFEKRKKEFGISLQKQAVESARANASPQLRKAALDELIDERLKAQEAKRQNITIDDAEVDRVLSGIAERNKLSMDDLKKQLGGGFQLMRNRIRANLAFQEVVKRRYAGQITVTSREVDSYVANASATANEDVELHLQRIRFTIPAKVDQSVVAQRLQDAENVRGQYAGCATMGSIAKGVTGAKFEDLGKRKPATVSEPTRSMLLNAADGEILPPTVGEGGVELWAVCSRTVIAAELQQRSQAEGQLKQKQFDLMTKRHIKDLRQDAHIEYR